MAVILGSPARNAPDDKYVDPESDEDHDAADKN